MAPVRIDGNSLQVLAGCQILLAGDGTDNQQQIASVLEKSGATVTIVDNGRAAVDFARESVRHGQPLDVILMELQMPLMDGYAAAVRLRAEGYHAAIVALTAEAIGREREKCLAAGCDDSIAKPLDRGRLLSIILRHYQRNHRPGSARSRSPYHAERGSQPVASGLA